MSSDTPTEAELDAVLTIAGFVEDGDAPDTSRECVNQAVTHLRAYVATQLERELAATKATLDQRTKDNLEALAEYVQVEDERNRIKRELTQLRSELAKARVDSERVDWLEKHGNFIEVGHGDIGADRASIDTARKQYP